MKTLQDALQSSPSIDCQHPDIIALASELRATTVQATALQLYYWVRDEIRYNPYGIDLSIDGMKASTTLRQKEGWCVPKAALLAALARANGIPALLGFADVRNHLSTERLRQTMGTDIFYFHGYCSLYLNDQWRKCTPAFNLSLCEKMNLQPLEFDGVNDSLYHPFDNSGNRHMEYINERGEFLDIPYDDMIDTFAKHYGNAEKVSSDHWEKDVAAEAISGQTNR